MQSLQLTFVINSAEKGKRIIFKIPTSLKNQDLQLFLSESHEKKDDTIEQFVEYILENFKIMGCVGQSFQGYSNVFIADLFSPKQSNNQRCTVFVVEDMKFISHPIFVTKDEQFYSQDNDQKSAEESQGVQLSSFTTVLAFQEKAENVLNIKELLYFFCKRQGRKKSLEFEQKRQNFVSKQISKILTADYEFKQAIKNFVKDFKKDEKLTDDIKNQIINKIKSLSQEMTKPIELFQLLGELFQSIISIEPMKFKIDGSTVRTFNPFSLQNQPPNIQRIKPFHTILIHRAVCQEQLELDAAPRFKKFIEQHNPKYSLLEISTDLNFDLKEVIFYAAHLVSWNAGKIINVIGKESVYAINPDINRETFNENLFLKFKKKFNSDLLQLLGAFSKPMPIHKIKDILKMDTPMTFNLITWFLKHSYLIEYNYYIFVSCSEKEFKSKVQTMRNSKEEKRQILGSVLDKIAQYSFKKVSVNQISFEIDVPREKVFKIIFNHSDLLDYYFTE